MWAARRYDVSKAVAFMRDAGWRLWGSVLVIGRFGVLLVWKEREAVAEAGKEE